MALWKIRREWEGETVFIIAGGPSVTQEQVDKLKGRKVIAIKLSCEKAPWADILFFADGKWFKPHKDVVKNFAGRVVTVAGIPDPGKILQLRKVPPDQKSPFKFQTDPTAIAVRRTSLTGAINLAVHLGGKKIVLLGADGKVEAGKPTHHHTPHPMPNKPDVFGDQAKDLEEVARAVKELGIEVFNINPASAFRMFPFLDLDVALQ